MKYIILFFLGITLLLSSCTPYAAQSDVIIQQGGSQNIIENITYNNITNITSFNITNITSYNITNITTNNITNISSYNANLSLLKDQSFVANVTEINFIGSSVSIANNGNGTANITITSSGGNDIDPYWSYQRRNAYISVLGTGAAFGVIGDSATITGTGSTPTINLSAGLQQNIVGVATTSSGALGVTGNKIWQRDFSPYFRTSWRSVEVTNASRIFVGLTTNTLVNQLANDQPTGDYIGVVGSNTRWTNYAIVSSNGTNVWSLNTSLAYNNADVMNITINLNLSGCSVFFNNVEYTVTSSSGCPRTTQTLGYTVAKINTTAGVQNIRVSPIFLSAER